MPVNDELVSVIFPPEQIAVDPLAEMVGVGGIDETSIVKVFVVLLDAKSVAIIDMVTRPDCPGSGETVIVREFPLPPILIFAFGITDVLLELVVMVTVLISSSKTVNDRGPTATPQVV